MYEKKVLLQSNDLEGGTHELNQELITRAVHDLGARYSLATMVLLLDGS